MNALAMEFENETEDEFENETETIDDLIEDKITFLKDGGFSIKLPKKEMKKMFAHCTTEIAVENVAKSILIKYL